MSLSTTWMFNSINGVPRSRCLLCSIEILVDTCGNYAYQIRVMDGNLKYIVKISRGIVKHVDNFLAFRFV